MLCMHTDTQNTSTTFVMLPLSTLLCLFNFHWSTMASVVSGYLKSLKKLGFMARVASETFNFSVLDENTKFMKVCNAVGVTIANKHCNVDGIVSDIVLT